MSWFVVLSEFCTSGSRIRDAGESPVEGRLRLYVHWQAALVWSLVVSALAHVAWGTPFPLEWLPSNGQANSVSRGLPFAIRSRKCSFRLAGRLPPSLALSKYIAVSRRPGMVMVTSGSQSAENGGPLSGSLEGTGICQKPLQWVGRSPRPQLSHQMRPRPWLTHWWQPREWSCQLSHSGPLACGHCEMMTVCCFKPRSLGSPVRRKQANDTYFWGRFSPKKVLKQRECALEV